MRLLQSGSPPGQQQAACALVEVAVVPRNRGVIAEAGGIDAMVGLLTSSVVGTPETAARALANLAKEGGGDESKEVPDAAAVGTLATAAKSEAVPPQAGAPEGAEAGEEGDVHAELALLRQAPVR